MRNMAIYQDKVFFTTTDARLVALDARTREGRLGNTDCAIARRATTRKPPGRSSSTAKSCRDSSAAIATAQKRCYISAYDANTGKQLWKFNTIARGDEPGGDTWGKLADNLRIGGETWITGSYDPELNLTYWGIAQAKPWMPASRGLSVFDAGLYTGSTLALNPDDGKLAWYYQHIPGESLDQDEVFERVLVDIGDRKFVFTIGKAGMLWKLDRKTGKFLRVAQGNGLPERLRPDRSDRPASRRIAPTSSKQKSNEWMQACPSTEGGHNWQAMSYNQPTGLLIIPLSQSCMEMQGRDVQEVDGSGGTGAARRFFEMPGTDGNVGKLAAYDVNDDEGGVEQRAARGVPDRACSPRRAASASSAISIARSARSMSRPARRSGRRAWARRCRVIPCTFSAGGKQYIAVATGLGGGSPRQVPRTITPDIKHPNTGNALYVFELPDKR